MVSGRQSSMGLWDAGADAAKVLVAWCVGVAFYVGWASCQCMGPLEVRYSTGYTKQNRTQTHQKEKGKEQNRTRSHTILPSV